MRGRQLGSETGGRQQPSLCGMPSQQPLPPHWQAARRGRRRPGRPHRRRRRTILEYVNAGLSDEFAIALSPVLFGSGIRLFEGVDAGRVALEPVRAEPTQRVTHVTYAVRER